jgi:hypothetical protein
VIGVHRVAQAEAVGQQRRPQQQRIMAKRHDCPQPGRRVEREQNSVDAEDLAAQVGGCVVEQVPQRAPLCAAGDLRGVSQAGIVKVMNAPILPF